MFLKFTTALLASHLGLFLRTGHLRPGGRYQCPRCGGSHAGSPSSGRENGSQIEPLDEHRIKIGNVIVNHKERTVSFQAQVNMKEGILEYVCCMPNGKLHESLLVTEADPLHISLGMTLLKFHRFEKFFPVRNENFEWLPFTEPKPEDYADSYVQIVMTYTENGREQKSDFSDIVVNSQTRKGLNPSDWLYTNSFFYEGAYQASLSGEVISIFASRTSPINYIGDFHDGVNDTGWIVNPPKTCLWAQTSLSPFPRNRFNPSNSILCSNPYFH